MSNRPRKLSEWSDKKEKVDKKVHLDLDLPEVGHPMGAFPRKMKRGDFERDTDTDVRRKISKITTQKQQGRYNIFIGERFAFGVDEAVLIRYQLAKGMVIDEALENEIKAYDHERKAYSRALNFLSHRLRTEKEVRDDLIEKEFESVVDSVIEKLYELKLIDDLEYAKSYVRTQDRLTGKGPYQITQALKKKGIKEEDIEIALEEYEDDSRYENAMQWAEKTLKRSKNHSSIQAKQRIQRTLIQKGFDSEIIQMVLAEIEFEKDEDEEWDALVYAGEKAWRSYQREELYERGQKTQGNLYRKGFPFDLIKRFIEMKKETEDDE